MSLKLTGRVMMRPSSSGKAMCMARSRAPRPCSLVSQAGWLSCAQIACSTGISRRNGRRLGRSGLDKANPVVLINTSAPTSSSQASTCSKQALSLRLATAIGKGLSPAASKRSQNTSMNAVLAACR
ncbi:hypothetical protein D3C76_1145930 [compost metagenome]